ncbi:hypothetical protein BDR05DRAFT_1001562 [Suillus weaverae]|nr:hypothetical protein BDR05DRAFT_1001562 [Suillus weaverae]
MVEQLKSIHKALHAAWAELVVQKLAPPTWSRICATGKKLVFNIMAKQFPLFLFDHCGWKLELLCITNYPSWHKNNLGNNRNWKDLPGKLSVKEEHIDNSDELDVEISELKHDGPRAKGNSKRHLSDDSESLVCQDHLKKPKFDSTPSPLLCIKPKDQDSEPGTSTNNGVSSSINDSLALKNTRITPTYPHDASAPPFGAYLLQPTPEGGPSLPQSPLCQSVYTSENQTSPTCCMPGTSHDIQCANKENAIILQDPLANIFGPNGITRTIPEPSKSNTKSVVKTKGKKKMQPGAAKNARNLCAWHWLKQVNDTSGTIEEFCMYWAALITIQQDEYKANTECRDVDQGF